MEEISYLRFFFALLFVVSLIVAAAWVFKRSGAARGLMGSSSERSLKVLEVLPLDTRRRLMWVKSGSKKHLLLVGGSNDIVVESSDDKTESK